jgi:hypothetical protein
LVKVSNDVRTNGGVADGGGTLGSNTTHTGTPMYNVYMPPFSPVLLAFEP